METMRKVVWRKHYDAGQNKSIEVYNRYLSISARSRKKLLEQVNAYCRTGWEVIMWEWRFGFIPTARMMRTIAREQITE